MSIDYLVFMLLFNLFMFCLIASQYRYVKCVKIGEKVSAKVINSKTNNLFARHTFITRRNNTTVSHVNVSYIYDGQEYQGKLTCVGKEVANAKDQIEIYVDPSNPKRIGHPSQEDSVILILFMSIMMDCVLLSIWFR